MSSGSGKAPAPPKKPYTRPESSRSAKERVQLPSREPLSLPPKRTEAAESRASPPKEPSGSTEQIVEGRFTFEEEEENPTGEPYLSAAESEEGGSPTESSLSSEDIQEPRTPRNITARTLATLALTRPPPISKPSMSGTGTGRTPEIKISTPSQFSGEPDDVSKWIRAVTRYLTINAHIYTTDEMKIIFALSFMQEGLAESWVDDYSAAAVQPTTGGGVTGYGTFTDFITKVTKEFGPSNITATAYLDATKLNQADCKSLVDYISKFKRDAGRASITVHEPFRFFFLRGLNEGLRRKVAEVATTSNTGLIEATHAKQAAYEELKTIRGFSGGNSGTKKKRSGKPRYHSDRDPDAMDVDRMSPEENARHRKGGLCFNCHEPGHVSRNCPKKNGAGKSSYGKNKVRREAADDETAKSGKSKIEEIEDSDEESDEEEMQVDRIRRIRVQKEKAKDF